MTTESVEQKAARYGISVEKYRAIFRPVTLPNKAGFATTAERDSAERAQGRTPWAPARNEPKRRKRKV